MTELEIYIRLRPGYPRQFLEESHERLCSDFKGFERSMASKYDSYPFPCGLEREDPTAGTDAEFDSLCDRLVRSLGELDEDDLL